MLESEILLLGIGSNKYKINEIFETDSLADIKKYYGEDSCFYDAYKTMIDFDHEKVYIANLETWEDLQNISSQLVDYNFDYICPLDLYLDDEYYDDIRQKNLYHSQMLLFYLTRNISTVIMTGKYAGAYEDLSSFLDDENLRIQKANAVFSTLRKENMVYVANNLLGYRRANVILACLLANADYAEYPGSNKLGSTIFDIDFSDVKNQLVFFKNNHLTGTTVENLVNFSDDNKKKLVTINKIMKYFHYHSPEQHEQFIGKTFTEYRRMKIEESLDDFLKNLVNWIIYKYQIISVTAMTSKDGTAEVYLKYDIWPKYSTERYRLEMTA